MNSVQMLIDLIRDNIVAAYWASHTLSYSLRQLEPVGRILVLLRPRFSIHDYFACVCFLDLTTPNPSIKFIRLPPRSP